MLMRIRKNLQGYLDDPKKDGEIGRFSISYGEAGVLYKHLKETVANKIRHRQQIDKLEIEIHELKKKIDKLRIEAYRAK